MAIVYKHIKTSGEIFYIGIGVSKKRAYSLQNRNTYWHNTVNKNGYNVEIICDDVDYKTAKKIESYLIYYYGRRDLGSGLLVNLTSGGEGVKNRSLESRQKQRDYRSGRKASIKTKIKMSESRKGELNPMFGKKHNKKTKELMSKSKLGISVNSKKVRELTDDILFDSVTDCAKYYNITQQTMTTLIRNEKINRGNCKNKIYRYE